MMIDAIEEKELIRRAKKGDEDSFETLMLSCKGMAFNIAFRYMQNADDALDATQESFLKVFRYLGKFNEQSRFDTWVYRIVVNTCNDMLRKNKSHPNASLLYRSGSPDEAVIEIADKAPGPDDLLLKKEESGFILECLGRLSGEHREVLILRDVRGFTYGEVSEMLGCSIGTVKSRISRAREKLKELYVTGNNADKSASNNYNEERGIR